MLFDISDYITWGFAGCEASRSIPITDLNWEDAYVTYNATRDAHLKAVYEYFLSSWTMRYSWTNDDVQHLTCYTESDNNAISNQFYEDYLDFVFLQLKSGQIFWNSLLAPTSFMKETGVVSYTFRRVIPNNPPGYIDIPYTIDYAPYQTVSKELYLEYRTNLENMMQSLKAVMKINDNNDFPTFIIPS